jgi:Ankyrin repeat.
MFMLKLLILLFLLPRIDTCQASLNGSTILATMASMASFYALMHKAALSDATRSLQEAVLSGDHEEAAAAINRGANIHDEAYLCHNTPGNTPLYNAAWNGHVKITELLLDHGATLEIINKNGLTPDFIKIQKKSPEAATLLEKAYIQNLATCNADWIRISRTHIKN